MSTVEFDVGYVEQRNRLTNAFRFILQIPHAIVAGVWGFAAEALAIAQWFVIVFTGRRHQGMWEWPSSSASACSSCSSRRGS